MQLLVYTTTTTPRISYIFSTLLPALGITEWRLTTDTSDFQNSTAAKINYSHQPLSSNELCIQPANLLFETGIKTQIIDCFSFNDSKAFFKKAAGDFPFDIFAASFYLMSRYEEYLPHNKDIYGRYAHENSLAYKEGFLQLPLINLWLQQFKQELKKRFDRLSFRPKPFSFLPTYDIDIAYSYLHKGITRNLGGFIKSMWDSEWRMFTERMNVLFAKQQDPFDSYGCLHQLHESCALDPLYFFLVAKANKGYDKHILPSTPAIKKLIKQHAQKYDIAIHPSWQSGDETRLLAQELKMLESLAGKKITKSRQHYIRMSLPDTYRSLINCGIVQDYSMGYGSINGFRASYCLPYFWYDLPREKFTNLSIHPFCYMDANSYFEQHYSSEEALKEMQYYYNITTHVNGQLITIWHNHFLGTDKMFRGWRESYEAFCRKMIG